MYGAETAAAGGYGPDTPAAEAEHSIDQLDALREKHKTLTEENTGLKRELVQTLARDGARLARENGEMREMLAYLRGQPAMPPRKW